VRQLLRALGSIYRITLSCSGIPPEQAQVGAADIEKEFKHRPWQKNVSCTWDGKNILIAAENMADSDGLALMDEFSDAISACIDGQFDSEISVVCIEDLGSNAT